MRNILFISILLLSALMVNAQSENHYTQFMWNTQLYNPAYVGSKGVPSLTALYRKQWIGFPGAPTSQLLSFNMPFFGKRAGFGMSLSHHGIGIQNNFYANLAYSYALIQSDDDFSLRLGLQGVAKYYNLDFSNESFTNDPAFNGGIDNALMEQNSRFLRGNVGLGLYMNYKDSYFGISSPNIIHNNINDSTNVATTYTSAQERRHIYMMGGVMIPAGKNWHIKPAVMAKYVNGAPFDFDANLSFIYNLKFSFGASYRYGGSGKGESIDFLTYFQVNEGLGFGLSYDYTLSDLQKYNSGSIELVGRYDFGKKGLDMTNPRFFF